MKLHHGSVRVESVLDRGTTFFVSIPRGTAHLPRERIEGEGAELGPIDRATPFLREAAEWASTAVRGTDDAHCARPSRTLAAPREPDMRLLVADDNADMREYVARLLAPRWSLELVADGQAALESALARPPDLVLSDVMMPRLTRRGRPPARAPGGSAD